MAQSGHGDRAQRYPLSGVKRTSAVHFAGLGHQLAVRVTSSSSSSLSGTKPLPPHVGHCCSSSVPFSMTPSPLQSGQVFTCTSLWIPWRAQPAKLRRNSNRNSSRTQFDVRFWRRVRPHPSCVEVDAAMARCRCQCSNVNTVVLVFSSVPGRHNKSGHAGRCFVHVRWIAVSSNRHPVEF